MIKEQLPKILKKKVLGNKLKIGNDTNFKLLTSKLYDGLKSKFEKELINGKYDESSISDMTLNAMSSLGKFKQDKIHLKEKSDIVTNMINV